MTERVRLLELFLQGRKAAIDSRRVGSGDVFFALAGSKFDGHDFLGEVATRGCRVAVVAKGYQGKDYGLELIKVDEPLKALQEAAREIQQRRLAKVVAITGSVGKTTTKDFVAQILSLKYRVGKSQGNANSQVGLPLTLINEIKPEDEVIVLEMGMTHPGEIERLVAIAPPDIVVITAIALVHAENFQSLEEIAAAKGEILSHPRTRLAIVGEQARGYCFKPIPTKYCYKSEAIGSERFPEHFAENLVCAQAVARAMGLTEEEIKTATGQLTLPEKRFEIGHKKGVLFVNDSYNASEPSVMAALNSLPKPEKAEGKTLAVLGEMLGLGQFSEACHKKVGELALKKVDTLFLVGEGCRPIESLFESRGRPVKRVGAALDLLKDLQSLAQPGDVVLLKGSNFWKIWELEEAF